MSKIYVLRHEERANSIDYGTPLTVMGYIKANKVVSKMLQYITFDTIYCSPFIRTIQTIEPYCRATNTKINLEWSLSESIPSKYQIPERFNDIINHDYTSYYDVEKAVPLTCNGFEIIKKRIRKFISSLGKSEHNILFVTHLPVINAIVALRGLENDVEIFTDREPGSILKISCDNISLDSIDNDYLE